MSHHHTRVSIIVNSSNWLQLIQSSWVSGRNSPQCNVRQSIARTHEICHGDYYYVKRDSSFTFPIPRPVKKYDRDWVASASGVSLYWLNGMVYGSNVAKPTPRRVPFRHSCRFQSATRFHAIIHSSQPLAGQFVVFRGKLCKNISVCDECKYIAFRITGTSINLCPCKWELSACCKKKK